MAAPNSGLFTTNGVGDGATGGYTQAEWIEFFRYFFGALQGATNGVLDLSSGTDLAVTGTASPVSVASGAALVYGSWFYDGSATSQAISTPVVGTTGFRIVLRASWAAETVRVFLISSADGVPGIPAAVQSAGTTWDLSLATGTITTGGVIALTDVRGFIHFPTRIDRSKIDGGTSERIPFNDSSGLLTDSAGLRADGASGRLKLQSTAPGVWFDETDSPTKGLFMALVAGVLEFQRKATNFGANEATVAALDFINGQLTITPTTGLPPLILGANGQGQRVVGLVAEPVGTLGLKRQGGSATAWNTQGATNRTITDNDGARMQVGVSRLTFATSPNAASIAITFPTAFSNAPIIYLSASDPSALRGVRFNAQAVTAAGFTISGYCDDTIAIPVTYDISWLAIGPQ